MSQKPESTEEDTLFEFPCEYPIKVMGADERELGDTLRQILQQLVPESADRKFTVRASSKGRYVAISVTITATSKPQLNDIYQMLTDAKEVLVAL